MELNGKVALVTGGSRGIGAATAKLLAAHGAAVAVNFFRSEEKAREVVAAIVAAQSPSAPTCATARRWTQWSAPRRRRSGRSTSW